MPPKKGGRKGRKLKKNNNFKPQMPMADKEDLLYAQILKKLGDRRFNVECSDDKIRQGRARGTMRKRVWINEGDVVLY